MGIIVHVVVGLGPLNNIRCTSHELGDGVAKFQVECGLVVADAGCAERTCDGAVERAAADGEVEGQADGVPGTVLVERAAVEHDG